MKDRICSMWRTVCKSGWQGILLIGYCFFILATNAFVSKDSVIYIGRSLVLAFLVCLVACPYVLKYINGISVDLTPKEIKSKNYKKLFLIFFFILLVPLLLLYLLVYPGCFCNDTIGQYEQALLGVYNDWHPVIQTLLAIKLPLLLTGGWTGSIILFQIIILCAVLSYAYVSVYKYAGKKIAVAAFLFVVLNPQLWSMALFVWKDNSFAIGATLLMTFVMHIYFTKGEWLKKPLHLYSFIAIFVVTTLFRHNAILFTVPLLLATFFLVSKKKMLAIGLSVVVLLVGIKGPLYSALNVTQPGSRQVETLGLPMTVIGAVVANDPESLDQETKDFAYAIVPKEIWETTFVSGSYNSIKWLKETNNGVIEEYGASKILSMMIRCIVRSPRIALTSLIDLTAATYTITGDYILFNHPYIMESSLIERPYVLEPVLRIMDLITVAVPALFPHIFMYFGVYHLILLIAVLAKCNFKTADGWKKLLIVFSVFAYNFGTTLLFTGFSDASRFFNYTRLVLPLLLVILFYKNNREEKASTPIR